MKKILDARKKQCPIPIIMAKDAMKEYNAKAVWDKWEKLIHVYA